MPGKSGSAGYQPAWRSNSASLADRMSALHLSGNVLLQMEAHASSSPGEVCGLIYEQRYLPLENVSGSDDRFYGSPVELARALSSYGEPLSIFHTHPNGNLQLSPEDRKMWYYSNSTMIVGCIRNGRLRWKVYGNRVD